MVSLLHCYKRTHFALAFEIPGGWHKEKEAMTLSVLQVSNAWIFLVTPCSEVAINSILGSSLVGGLSIV